MPNYVVDKEGAARICGSLELLEAALRVGAFPAPVRPWGSTGPRRWYVAQIVGWKKLMRRRGFEGVKTYYKVTPLDGQIGKILRGIRRVELENQPDPRRE